MPYLRTFLAFCCICFLLCSIDSFGQGHKITGRIVDAETLDPLPFAHVFIDQTTIGAVTDINGEFVMESIENGDYRLVFSYVGYELFYKSITVNGSDVRASARLIPQKELLQNVEVKGTRDKEWENQLRQFKRVFFGENDWAKECVILNPWALEFIYDKEKKRLTAVAGEPVEIENRAMGYKLQYTLQSFSSDKKSYKIKGLFKFEELNTLDAQQATRWTRNRKLAYQNSLRFIIKSILDKHTTENGFAFFKDSRRDGYTSHSGLFSEELMSNHLKPFDFSGSVTPTGNPGQYKIDFPEKLEIHHLTQVASSKTYRDVIHPVSWVEIEKGPVLVTENGSLLNTEAIVTSGELNQNRVAHMLPKNYSPGSLVVVNYLTKRNMAKRLQERSFIQTDKQLYYPKETIWFKAHINHANQAVRDSLSRVLYIELIEKRTGTVKQSGTFEIDSAGARGAFKIDSTLTAGDYSIRAYTSWMRNYGDDVVFYSPIFISDKQHILKIKEPVNQKKQASDFSLQINPSVSDSLTMLLMLDSSLVHRTAWCAISVAPTQTAYSNTDLFHQALTFGEDLPEGTLPEFQYPLEWGFSIKGKLLSARKKALQGQVTAIQGNMDSLYILRTNRRGEFEIAGLSFSDSTSFAFQPSKKKGRSVGTVELQSRDIAKIKITTKRYFSFDTLQTLPDANPEKKDTKTKKELGKKQVDSIGRSAFGSIDYLLTAKDLENMPGGQSLVGALPSRVPGLHYSYATKSLTFRANSLNMNESTEPLFILDGAPIYVPRNNKINPQQNQQTAQPQSQPKRETNLNGPEGSQNAAAAATQTSQSQTSSVHTEASATEMLSYLTVGNISRVEISTKSDARYGSLGAYGVIVITTKKGGEKSEQTKKLDVFTVQGFAKPENFIKKIINTPVDADCQQTWYWNPDVFISSKNNTTLKLPALPKGIEYKLTIVGTAHDGSVVYGSYLLSQSMTKAVSASLDQHQK